MNASSASGLCARRIVRLVSVATRCRPCRPCRLCGLFVERIEIRISMRSTNRPQRRQGRHGRHRVATDTSRTIRLAHSPDADDAFMFWALAAGRIDTGDRRYVHELGDIESLNRRALAGELEVTAVSLHAYAYLADRYALLAHGASIGDRYGPRIVACAP